MKFEMKHVRLFGRAMAHKLGVQVHAVVMTIMAVETNHMAKVAALCVGATFVIVTVQAIVEVVSGGGSDTASMMHVLAHLY